MESETKYIKNNIEKDDDNEMLLKTHCNYTAVTVNDIPDKNSTNESEEDNREKKEPKFYKQFSILRVYLIAICVFSISGFLLPFIHKYSKSFYNTFKISINDREIGKTIRPTYSNHGTEMEKTKSQNYIYSNYLIQIIYFLVIGPFVEEFLYRWLIFGFIKKYGQKVKKTNKCLGICIIVFAFIFSSILYSFGHFNIEGENLHIKITYLRTYLDIDYFFMGIIYAWVYYHYGYILITILAQILNNSALTIFALYMYASDCYDGCAIHALAIVLPYYGFNLIVIIILIIRWIYKCCKK